MKIINLLKKPGQDNITEITLLVTVETLTLIENETQRYAQAGLETGGVLVGRWLADGTTAYIAAATGSGPRANHEAYSFALDTEHANAELDRLTKQYPGTDYIGEWHKHPPTLERPSSGDLRTVRNLLDDPDYPPRLINPISLIRDGKVIINFFYISRNIKEFVQLSPDGLQRINDPDIDLPPNDYYVYYANVKIIPPVANLTPTKLAALTGVGLFCVLAFLFIILNWGKSANGSISAEDQTAFANRTAVADNLATITARAFLPTATQPLPTNTPLQTLPTTPNNSARQTAAAIAVASIPAPTQVTTPINTLKNPTATAVVGGTPTPESNLPKTALPTAKPDLPTATPVPAKPATPTPKTAISTATPVPAKTGTLITATPPPAKTVAPNELPILREKEPIILSNAAGTLSYKLTFTGELTNADVKDYNMQNYNILIFANPDIKNLPQSSYIKELKTGQQQFIISKTVNYTCFFINKSNMGYNLVIQNQVISNFKFDIPEGKRFKLEVVKINGP